MSDLEPRARLRVVHPTDLRWSRMLPIEGHALIGRIEAETVTMALAHGTVSRRHFELRWNDAARQYEGRDLGSHNGSRIDGRDIGSKTVPLRDGSVLQLGDVCLVYEQVPEHVAERPPPDPSDPIVGRSASAAALRQAVAEAASHRSPVLLVGEAGTGKEHVARQIHALSRRAGPMVVVDCSTLDPRRAERQLFGHVAEPEQLGRLRAAHGGTVYFDGLDGLPLPVQPPLLRALTRGECTPVDGTEALPLDVRVITATQGNLEQHLDAGGLLPDLHAHLTSTTVVVPPLRKRRGDLFLWLERLHVAWLDENPDRPVNTLTVSADAAEAMLLYDWPNNLRQLERLVHDLASTPHAPRPIPRSRLPNWLRTSDPNTSDARITAEVGPPAMMTPSGKPPVPSREEFTEVFERLEGNVRAMAKHFARDRRQIYRWIESHGLSDRRPKRK